MINNYKIKSSSNIYISWLGSIYHKTNKKEFIKSIDSIQNQQCNYIQEIVLIKDGEIDNELEDLINNYNFKLLFRLIEIDQNKGLGNAMKVGALNCRGRFIARFDTDDINLKNRLSIQVPIIESDPKIAVVSGSVFEINEKGKIFHKDNFNSSIKKIIFKFNPINHPSVIINKESLLKIGNYKNIKYFEDYYLWLKFIKKGFKLKIVDNPLVIMKIDNNFRKRWGFKYSFYEMIFTFTALKENLITFPHLIFFMIRIISRLILIPPLQSILRRSRRKSSINITL